MSKFWDDYPEQFNQCVAPYIGTSCLYCKEVWRDVNHIMDTGTWFTSDGLAHYSCFEKALQETYNLLPVGTRVIWENNLGTIEGYGWYYAPRYTLLLDKTPIEKCSIESAKRELEYTRQLIAAGDADTEINSLTWWKAIQKDLDVVEGCIAEYRLRTGVPANTVTPLEYTNAP